MATRVWNVSDEWELVFSRNIGKNFFRHQFLLRYPVMPWAKHSRATWAWHSKCLGTFDKSSFYATMFGTSRLCAMPLVMQKSMLSWRFCGSCSQTASQHEHFELWQLNVQYITKNWKKNTKVTKGDTSKLKFTLNSLFCAEKQKQEVTHKIKSKRLSRQCKNCVLLYIARESNQIDWHWIIWSLLMFSYIHFSWKLILCRELYAKF